MIIRIALLPLGLNTSDNDNNKKTEDTRTLPSGHLPAEIQL